MQRLRRAAAADAREGFEWDDVRMNPFSGKCVRAFAGGALGRREVGGQTQASFAPVAAAAAAAAAAAVCKLN